MKCNLGFYGADCSITVSDLNVDNLSLGAKAWQFFKVKSKGDFEVNFNTGSSTIQVFTQMKDIPTRSNHTGYYEGNNIRLLLKGSKNTHFIGVYNTHHDRKVNVAISENSAHALPAFLSYGIIFLILVLIAMIGVNIYMCVKERKGVHYVGINESGESAHLA